MVRAVVVDAIVLTGGRSSRLSSVTKSELMFEGETLLRRTLRAAHAARSIVVVGPEPRQPLPVGVLCTRESPPFGGPVAGIAAGMLALRASSAAPSDAVLVLACDMPHIARAVPELLLALASSPGSDGVIAVDTEQHRQPLAACYRTLPLTTALSTRGAAGPLAGMSMFRLLDGLDLVPTAIPPGATADVDTWEDAQRLGTTVSPLPTESKETP